MFRTLETLSSKSSLICWYLIHKLFCAVTYYTKFGVLWQGTSTSNSTSILADEIVNSIVLEERNGRLSFQIELETKFIVLNASVNLSNILYLKTNKRLPLNPVYCITNKLLSLKPRSPYNKQASTAQTPFTL